MVGVVRFPDTVTVERAFGVNEYGDADASFADPTIFDVAGFLVTPETLLCPPTADVRTGDRLTISGRTYSAEVVDVRSPSALKLRRVKVSEIGAA